MNEGLRRIVETTATTYEPEITRHNKRSGLSKPYVAAVNGTSDRYGLNRTFLTADDSTEHRSGQGWWTWHLTDGLYEVESAQFGREYYVVADARRVEIDEASATQLAEAMSERARAAGHSLDRIDSDA